MDCKVISLQLIKINEKKNLYGKMTMIKCYMKKVWYVYGQGWNSTKLKSICVKHEESGVSLFPAFYIFHSYHYHHDDDYHGRGKTHLFLSCAASALVLTKYFQAAPMVSTLTPFPPQQFPLLPTWLLLSSIRVEAFNILSGNTQPTMYIRKGLSPNNWITTESLFWRIWSFS